MSNVGYHYCSNPECFNYYTGEQGYYCLECEEGNYYYGYPEYPEELNFESVDK